MYDSTNNFNNLLDEEAMRYGENGYEVGSPNPHQNKLSDLYNSRVDSMLD